MASKQATDSTHAYVALYNSDDTDAREAWIGYNDAGFAIMNTASYNLRHPSDGWKDREGFIMSEALARCATVDDFRQLLQSLPKPLGVEANFGVIDATGGGGFFETDDYDFTFYPLDEDNPIIIRTNYSVSGGEGGLGHSLLRILPKPTSRPNFSPTISHDLSTTPLTVPTNPLPRQ